jgi:leucyl aminopeptidase
MAIATSLNNQSPVEIDSPCLVIGVSQGGELSDSSSTIDAASGGVIRDMLLSGDIDSGLGKCTMLHRLDGLIANRLLVIGFGQQDKLDMARYDRACLKAGQALLDHPVSDCHVCLHDMVVPDCDSHWRLRQAAVGVQRENYLYTTTKAPKDKGPELLTSISFQGGAELQAAVEEASAIAAGFLKARLLGDLPPNICTPAYLASEAASIADTSDNLELEVLEEKELEELGMHALLGVARGSANRPRLIVLNYTGADPSERPYVFVGKGVTFDSGGLSLKPPGSMEQMKYDMCGASSVMGAVLSCASLQLPINLVGVIPAVENMPDADAYRPGDVLTTMSGQTVEVLNTDAEGRLILCDALTWSRKLNPKSIVDVATLTGACVVALGNHATALISNDDELADDLLSAGQSAMDRAWRMPLWDEYQSQLDTKFADMKNVGGSSAGVITAACFLSRFATDQRWAHLDVAGTAFSWEGKDGASGRPVGLLIQYLIDQSHKD